MLNTKFIPRLIMANSYFSCFTKFQIRRNEYQMPTTQHLSKVQMNHYTRDYLQAMVEQNRLVRQIFPFLVYTSQKNISRIEIQEMNSKVLFYRF